MNKMIKSSFRIAGFIVLILMLGVSHTHAQRGNIFTNFKKIIARADQHFNDNAYVAAIDLYKAVLEKEPDNKYAKIKIARAYKKINNSAEAETWFRAAIENNTHAAPLDQLYFAQVLMTNGKHQEAKYWLVQYTKAKKDIRALNNLVGIEQLNLFFKDSAAFQVRGAGINADGNDFSPVFYDSLLIFLSNREKFTPIKYVNAWTDNGFYDVYQAELEDGFTATNPKVFNKSINSKYHEGPLAFYNQGQNMIFTRSIDQKATNGGSILGLFTAERSADKKRWENTQAFPFNHTEYSVFHPAISEDGDTLYFSSEMPGGYGGGDIYRSIMENGNWGKPENMGSQVNTEGNELFPYLHNQLLYFSSDGHAGLGGLDIYQVELYKNQELQLVNLGYPLNSTYDDFSIAWYENQQKGAFTSNRPNGAGSDDIYFFLRKTAEDQKIITINGRILDKIRQTAVEDALVYIIDEETGTDYSLQTDKAGSFSFEGIKGNSYTILADKSNKSGLISGKVINSPEELIHIEIWGFPPYITIETEVRDSASGEGVKLATVKLLNHENVISQAQSTFSGKAVVTGTAGNDYTINIAAPGYEAAEKEISIPENTISDTIRVVVALEKIKPKTAIIEGLVIDAAKGNGLDSALVYVVNERTGTQLVLTTDSDGKFTFEGQINQFYKVIAEVEDNRAVVSNYKVEDTAVAGNKPVLLPVIIKNQQKKQDRVKLYVIMQDNNSGEGIPFGVVKLFSEDTIRLLDYTNIDGKLMLDVEKGKAYTLKSDVIGYKESSAILNTTGELLSDTLQTTLSVEMLERQMIRGLAVDQNSENPEAEAKIYIINTSTEEEQLLHANADGEFNFRAKEGERVSILAEKVGKRGVLKDLILTERHFNTPLHLKLNYISSNISIVLQVSDKSGDAVPLAQIQLKQHDVPQQLVKSDMQGTANLKAKTGLHYLLEISHAGYKTKNLALETSVNPSDTLHVAVMLEKQVPGLIAMKGSLLMEGAKATKPGAQIAVVNANAGRAHIAVPDNIEENELQARTDDDETADLATQEPYSIASEEMRLKPGSLQKIEALKPDIRNSALSTKSISQIIEENQIQFGEITGFVYDQQSGKALSGASVQMINNSTGASYVLHANPTGHVKFVGKVGQEFTVLAETGTKVGLFPEVQISSLTDTLKLGISGAPEVAVLHIHVLDAASEKAVRLASIALTENGNMIQQEQTQISGSVFFRANAGAKYAIGVKTNQYEDELMEIELPLESSASDTVSFTVLLTKKQPQLIALPGKVVDEVTGRGVDSVLVFIMDSKTWEVETVMTDSRGGFSFKGYEGEKYQLIGEKKLRGTGLLDVALTKSQEPVVLKIEHEATRQPDAVKPLHLQIALRDKVTGEAIAGGVVKISAQDTVKQTTYTDSHGNKLVYVTKDAAYYVEGRMKNYHPAGQRVIAQTQNVTDTIQVLIALEPIQQKEAIMTGITVDGHSLEALAGATVFIQNTNTGEEQEITSGLGGEFEFKGAVGETYTILAEKGGHSGRLNRFVLRESTVSSSLQIMLYPVAIPLVVKIALSDKASGTAVSLANIALQFQDVYQQKLVTDQKGEGIFHAQSGRDYRLDISHPAYLGQRLVVEASSAQNDTLYVNAQLDADVPLMLAMHGHVYDVVSNRPLPGANIYIINNRDQEVLEFNADERGDFSFQATEGYTYTILADTDIRSGMVTDLLINDPLEKANPFIKIPAFGMLEPVTVLVQVVDEPSGMSIPGALVKQYANNTQIREGLADNDGKLIWEEYKNEGYHLVVEHQYYAKRLFALDFGNVPTEDTLAITIALKNVKEEALMAGIDAGRKGANFRNIHVIHNTSGNGQVFLSTDQGLFAYRQLNGKAVLDNNNKEVIALSEGWSEEESLYNSLLKVLEYQALQIEDTVTVQNVYYGFDKFHLSKKAMVELDHIATVMRKHLEINVELKAYTDSRGPASYNKELAKKRVQAAFQYLVGEGIAEGRIMQIPVGEADFVKDCSVEPCTESDHKLNRRTEMLIRYEVEMLGRE